MIDIILSKIDISFCSFFAHASYPTCHILLEFIFPQELCFLLSSLQRKEDFSQGFVGFIFSSETTLS